MDLRAHLPEDPLAWLLSLPQRLWALARYTWHQFQANGGMDTAAALTYTTLFAIVPLMTVGFSFVAVLPAFESVGTEIQDFLFANFLPATGAVVQERLLEYSDSAKRLTVVGVLVLVVTAYLMLARIERAFNTIWRVPQPRKGLSKFLLYWGVLTFGPPLLVTGLSVTSYLISLPIVTDIDGYGLREKFLFMLPMLASGLVFTLLYAAVPNCQVKVRWALVGGLVTMITFEIAKQGFAAFVARSNFGLIYGAFAAVPVFLMWIYLCWTLVLIGAELTRALSIEPAARGATVRDPLLACLKVLKLLHLGHQQGRAVADADVAREVQDLSLEGWQQFSARLAEARLIARTEDGSWMLAHDLDSVSLWDIYRIYPDPMQPDDVNSEWASVLGADGSKALSDFLSSGREALDVDLATLFGRGQMDAPISLHEARSG